MHRGNADWKTRFRGSLNIVSVSMVSVQCQYQQKYYDHVICQILHLRHPQKSFMAPHTRQKEKEDK